MSQVVNCPMCGGKSKTKEVNNSTTYFALQAEEILLKVSQLKKAMEKFKAKSEALEQELKALKANQ